MGWDKGRYYTRSKKINGQVIREYFGSGPIGELEARSDARERKCRADELAAWKAKQDEMESLDEQIIELCDLCDKLARAALMASGFFQHNRGEWRKRRVQGKE